MSMNISFDVTCFGDSNQERAVVHLTSVQRDKICTNVVSLILWASFFENEVKSEFSRIYKFLANLLPKLRYLKTQMNF